MIHRISASGPGRLTTAVISFGLLLTMLGSVPAASATQVSAPVTNLTDPNLPDSDDVAAAETAASAEARRTGEPVVVDPLTSETRQVTAEPDGLFRAEMSTTPVRTQAGDEWIDLDPTLVRRGDGRLEPRSGLDDMVISGGGPAGSVLASYQTGGHSFVVRTPYPLPTPTIEDNLATFIEVLPGVDLVVKTSNAGFSHNWVVKNREAAQDSRVRALTLPLEIDGLQAEREDGGVSYVDDAGLRQFWSPTPTMWDSSSLGVDPTGADEPVRDSIEAVEDGPTQADQVSTVATSIDDDSMTLKADRSLLDDPEAVFPIVIDPYLTSTRNRTGWTAVWNNFPTKSFWKTDHTLGAGYEGYEQFKVVRSYFQFDVKTLGGKYIVHADMNVRQVHDASCSARATYVYRTATIGTATTWSKQPTRYEYQSSNSSTAGCGSSTAMVGWNVTTGMTNIAKASGTTANFLIRAQDEGDKIAWKQYDDAGAELVVKYVSTPKVPTPYIKTATKSYPCGSSEATAPVIGATSVTIGATVSSVDSGATLNAVFRRRDLASSADITPDAVGNTVAPGGQSQITWSLGSANKSLRYQVRTRVSWGYNGSTGYLYSAFNGTWCYFKTDTTRPDSPTVTPVSFAECASPTEPTSCPALGLTHTPGTVKVKAATADGTSYHWTLNGGTEQSTSTAAGAERTITLTPDRIVNNLVVWTEDGANESLPSYFTFKVDKRDPEAHWTFDDAGNLSENSGTATTNLDTIAATALSSGRIEGGLRLAGGSANAGSSSVQTSGSDFTVATWARVDINSTATLISAPSSTTSPSAGFELGYDAATNQWTAGRRASDNTTSVAGSPTALSGAWTHLAATYQATTNKTTLYVNGVARSSVTYPSAAFANTGWRLGCGNNAGSNTRCLNGALDDTQLYAVALSPEEIVNLANPTYPGNDHPILSSAALWSMNDLPASNTAAESIFGAGLNLVNVAQTPDGTPRDPFGPSDDQLQQVLDLPGLAAQQARTSRAVVDSMGSFSVMAHVRPLDPTRSMVIAQQRGLNRDAWTLGYKAAADGTGGRWVFQRNPSDSTSAVPTEVRSTFQPDVSGDFTYVQGVYDADSGEIALYVNGAKFEDEPDPATEALQDAAFTTPWAARSYFEVGNGALNGVASPFFGEINQVFLLAGALDADAAFNYYAAL